MCAHLRIEDDTMPQELHMTQRDLATKTSQWQLYHLWYDVQRIKQFKSIILIYLIFKIYTLFASFNHLTIKQHTCSLHIILKAYIQSLWFFYSFIEYKTTKEFSDTNFVCSALKIWYHQKVDEPYTFTSVSVDMLFCHSKKYPWIYKYNYNENM